MKKKLALCMAVFTLALGLMACGKSEDTAVLYGGYEQSYYEKQLDGTVESLLYFGHDEVAGYIENYGKDEAYAAPVGLLSDWDEIMDEIGQYKGIKEHSVVKSGKTITATAVTEFENRDVRVVFVYTSYAVDDGPTSMNAEIVYTKGEIMKTALLNTVMGIMIVFTMLVVMAVLISLFKYVNKLENKLAGNDKPTDDKVSANPVVEAAAADDLELVAVIAAAIAASTGASTDSFVVRSIKKRR